MRPIISACVLGMLAAGTVSCTTGGMGSHGAMAETSAGPDAKRPFEIDGMYVEGCSCSAPCPCELTGLAMGCQGVGAFRLTKASYMGTSLDGVVIAYGVEPGSWVTIFVDVKDPKQKPAAISFAKASFEGFGKVEAVREVPIDIAGHDGRYTARVDGGKVFTLTTEPILGGDGKTPLVYSNIHDPVHPTVMQGRTLACDYHDGTHSFQLKGSNAYFNPGLRVKGRL